MDKKITVQNRSGSVIGYRLPEINLSRTFAPDEEKQIPADELQKLAYQAGGQELIDAYLLIKDAEVATEISPLASKEPEYNLNSDAVIQLLKSHNKTDSFGCPFFLSCNPLPAKICFA